MIKEAYKVVLDADAHPIIRKVEITDLDGVSWRDAKKQLRQWYLNQAKALRSISEKTYFEIY